MRCAEVTFLLETLLSVCIREKEKGGSDLSCLSALISTYTVVGSGPDVPCKQQHQLIRTCRLGGEKSFTPLITKRSFHC